MGVKQGNRKKGRKKSLFAYLKIPQLLKIPSKGKGLTCQNKEEVGGGGRGREKYQNKFNMTKCNINSCIQTSDG